MLASSSTPVWAEVAECFGVEESGSESRGAVSGLRPKCSPYPYCCGFICFPRALPPQHQRGGVTGTWRRFPSLGRSQSAQIKNLGPRPGRLWPQSGLAQVPKAMTSKRVGRSQSGQLKGRGHEMSHLGEGPESRGLRSHPDSSLFTSERLSQCHVLLARNLFPRIWAPGSHWSLLKAGFYSSQSAALKSMGFSAIG